jgi:hypothetical protein
LNHSASPFLYWVFLRLGFSTVCLGWLQTAILLISASWVARITSVSHQCLAGNWVLYKFSKCSHRTHF